MKFAKEFKKSFILLIVCCFALGVILLLYPQLSEIMLCYALGALTIVSGVTFLVRYFLRKNPAEFYRFDFVVGVVLASCGVYLIVNASSLVGFLNILLGLVLLLDGLMKLQNAMDLYRMGNRIWWSVLLCTALVVFLGVMLLWCKDWHILTRMQWIGLCLIVLGMVDAWSFSVLSLSLGKLRKRTEEDALVAAQAPPAQRSELEVEAATAQNPVLAPESESATV